VKGFALRDTHPHPHSGGHLRRGPFALVRRLGWGVADQAVSSMSNFVLGIVVARSLGAEGFGAFSLAYVTYAFLLSGTRGLSTDPLVVRYSGPATDAWRRAVAASVGTALGLGLVTGLGCALVGLALPGTLGTCFVVLGALMPMILAQDAWRFVFFSVGRPAQALLNDLVWGVMQVGAVLALVGTDRIGAASCLAVFGLTAGVAAAFGYLQAGIRPRLADMRAWLVDHRSLGSRYLVENVAMGGARQIRFVALGAFGGLVAVGEVRAAEILMGPFLVMLMGLSQVSVPEGKHVLDRAPHRLGTFCLGLGLVQALAALVWGLLVLLLLHRGVGDLLLGPIWPAAAALVPIMMVQLFGAGIEIGAAAGVRALGAARRSLRAQLVVSFLYLLGGTLGAVVDGARGSCWGVALSTVVGAFVWWAQLRRGLADHLRDGRLPPRAEPAEVVVP
jgi:O-antigen/teichoic acid export membrane protein